MMNSRCSIMSVSTSRTDDVIACVPFLLHFSPHYEQKKAGAGKDTEMEAKPPAIEE